MLSLEKSKSERWFLQVSQITISRSKRVKNTFRRAGRYWQLYLLVLIPMATVFIFHYIPVAGVQIAFRDYTAKGGFFGSKWVGFKHFTRFFNYPKFWQIIWNTLRINLYTLATFPLPVILAIMFNDLRNGLYKRTTQMLTYAPHFVSTVVLCSLTIMFLNRETGVINVVIRLFGGEGGDWMGKSKLFPLIYVVSGLWQNLGWDTIIFLSALSSLSAEQIEAAHIDGANSLRVVRHIYIPHLKPTVITMFLLKMGTMVHVGFEKVFLLQNPLNLDSSTVLGTYIYEVGIKNGQFSYASAVGLFESAVSILIVVIFNYISRTVSETSLW